MKRKLPSEREVMGFVCAACPRTIALRANSYALAVPGNNVLLLFHDLKCLALWLKARLDEAEVVP